MQTQARISQMSILQEIADVAYSFQVANNLDRSDVMMILQHDYIHATLGLGVTTAEEELVEAIEIVLEHGHKWNSNALELARTLPIEFKALYKFGNI